MSALQDKLFYAGLASILYLIVSNGYTYHLSNSLFKNYVLEDGCPTIAGHLGHSVFFFILMYTLLLTINFMNGPDKRMSALLLLKYAFYGTLLFFIISSTEIYALIGNITNNYVATSNGCPTTAGIFIHAIVYFFVLFGVMFFPKDV